MFVFAPFRVRINSQALACDYIFGLYRMGIPYTPPRELKARGEVVC